MGTTRLSLNNIRKHDEISTQYTIWVGLIVCAVLVGYFLLMRAFGLHEVLILSSVNVFFILAGIVYALRKYNHEVKGDLDYFKGFEIGLKVSVFANVPFTVFLFIYLVLDNSFMDYIIENAPFGEYLGPARTAGVIFIEGIVAGFVSTFMFMQFYKTKHPEH